MIETVVAGHAPRERDLGSAPELVGSLPERLELGERAPSEARVLGQDAEVAAHAASALR